MYATRAAYRQAWQDSALVDPTVPLNLDIELASTCNAKCSFCLYGDRDWAESMGEKDWDGKTKKRFMPTDMALRLIDEAAEIGIPAIKTNFRGESTLHPDYHEIMAYARRATSGGDRCSCHMFGAHPAFYDILVNTNGNCPPSAIDGLMCATKVMVSLDSMDPDIYPKVRVGLSLGKAQATIDEIVSRRHPDVWVRRVVCRDNKDEDFVGAVKARWPAGVRVSEHSAFERNHYKNEALYSEDPSNWERRYCQYPSQRIVVEASGRYSACCIAWEGELSGGTYPKTSLMDYWNSPWRRKLADNLRRNMIENDKCRKCTSFMAYSRPERDKVQDVEVTA